MSQRKGSVSSGQLNGAGLPLVPTLRVAGEGREWSMFRSLSFFFMGSDYRHIWTDQHEFFSPLGKSKDPQFFPKIKEFDQDWP